MQVSKSLSFNSIRKTIANKFNAVIDWRQKVKVDISIHDALMSGLACMFYQDPSLLQFQKRLEDDLHQNNLRTMFNVEDIPKPTQMRDIIDEVHSDSFSPIFKELYSRLQRGKHLEQYQLFSKQYYFPIDGTEFYSSKNVSCEHCLVCEYTEGVKTYSHKVLQGGIMYPDRKQVIPFMPEHIVNSDGADKNDCEMNAAKRLVYKLRKEFPRLDLIIGGDALFSKHPIITDVLNNNFHYIFVAKPSDHTYMFDFLSDCEQMFSLTEFIDEKGRTHIYEWLNEVPLTAQKDTVIVNYFSCKIIGKDKSGMDNQVLYRNTWVTDISISEENIKTLVRGGRCRWKSENECFNVLKNHGYEIDHSYGHGDHYLAFNFYLLTLLAFFMHQIYELTSKLYQANRKKFGSKVSLWNTLRSYIRIIIFESFDALLEFALNPKRYQLTPIGDTS